ncbi:MAG: metallophosphoesterase [Firmicutes bacterium]|nr:metallophosphoesterase [Bacillota bacterium]
MATYFISDIHGEYKLFRRLLESIKFSDSDTMIVLGDFLDKGNECIKLAKFIARTPNIKAINGNHEYFFLGHYQYVMREFDGKGSIDSVLVDLQEYFYGEQEKITWDLIDFLESLPYYVETDDYLCVHAGVKLDSNGKIMPIKEQDYNHFIFDRSLANAATIPKNSKTVIFGHTPCHYFNNTGHIIKTPHARKNNKSNIIKDFAKIQVDTGANYTGLLGCLRLDDMAEFYVEIN